MKYIRSTVTRRRKSFVLTISKKNYSIRSYGIFCNLFFLEFFPFLLLFRERYDVMHAKLFQNSSYHFTLQVILTEHNITFHIKSSFGA